MNTEFKKEAKKFEIIAIADIRNGVSIDTFKNEIKIQEKKENFIVCEGLNNAINKMNIDTFYKNLESKLLNSVVFCNKNIVDTDFIEIVIENETIKIIKCECGETRHDLQYLEVYFKSFLENSNTRYCRFKIYIDGSHHALGAFINNTFYNVKELYKNRI